MANAIDGARLVRIVNGDHFIGSGEGEAVDDQKNKGYIVPVRISGVAAPLAGLDADLTEPQIKAFLHDQVNILKAAKLDDRQACVCAYIRLFSFVEGLISDQFDPDAHHVKYNECQFIEDDDALAAKVADIDAKFEVLDANACNAVLAALDGDGVEKLSEAFCNMAGMVAFFMRVRGHHFLDELEARYGNVWNKCRMEGYGMPVPAKYWATYGLHAIMPDVLDQAWKYYAQNQMVSGALVKRYDCAAAGMAGVVVVKAGVEDLMMVAPGFKKQLQDASLYLDEICNYIKADRWYGSINAPYYGSVRVTVDEKKLAAVASAVAAILNTVAPESDLNKSQALKRIARGAPITGAILGRAAVKLSDSPGVIKGLTGEVNQPMLPAPP